MHRILAQLGRRGRKKVRMVSKALSSLVGASFLPTPLSGEAVLKLLESDSALVGLVEELIVPLELSSAFVKKLSGVRKMHFSASNLVLFNRLRREDFPGLRKVTFQGSDGLKLGENVPKFVEDLVFYEAPVEEYEISKRMLEDALKNVSNLRSLEVWSGRQYPDIFTANLRRLRLMGGLVASSITYALHQITNACPQLEELVMTCKPMAAFNLPDHFDRSSILSYAHPTLKKLRILYSFTKPIAFAMPCLERLTLDAPQHHFISLSKTPRLLKLSLTSSPLVISNLFLRPPPSLTTCVLTLITGQSPRISKTRVSALAQAATLAKPPSVPSLPTAAPIEDLEDSTQMRQSAGQASTGSGPSPRSHTRSASITIAENTSKRSLKGSFDDSTIPSPQKSKFFDSLAQSPPSADSSPIQLSSGLLQPSDQGVSPPSPSSRRKIINPNSNRHSSGRPNDICISICSSTLKKCDIRIATMEDSFPHVRDFKLEAENLENLIFQIHPNAVAPNSIHLSCPSLSTLSTCLHPNLLPELFPNFEKFEKLEKLFVTLQDEDVLQMAPLMQPYLHWELGNISALGLSNVSILTGMTIRSKFLHSLLLENMHSIPYFLLENLDDYLPCLTHLEIKAPDLEDRLEYENQEEEEKVAHSPKAASSFKTSSSEIDRENPYFMQKEYRDMCPKQKVTIRSSSLRSLIYTLELPHHPTLHLPELREILYLQQDSTEAFDMKSALKGMPKLEMAYIGVASVTKCHITHQKIKKLKLVFGYTEDTWAIKAPKLEKVKLIRIIGSLIPRHISLSHVSAPSLKNMTLVGVVIDEDSCNKLPESTFVKTATMDMDI
jgi:hypothetical protein